MYPKDIDLVPSVDKEISSLVGELLE